MTKLPEQWRDEIIEFARSFASLSRTDRENQPTQIHLRRNPGDLMHVMGYYFEQNSYRLRDLSSSERLSIMAETLRFIAAHLED